MVVIKSKNCRYDGSDAFNGIVAYFRNVTKTKDPYQKGLINILVSAGEDKKHNVFVDESDAYTGFWNANGANNWITIDFGLNKVSLTHYTIKAWGQDFFSKWEVSASNNNSNWEVIHDGKLESMPQNELKQATNRTFETEKVIPRSYIRIKSLSPRFAGEEAFYLHRLEFFGKFHLFGELKESVHCRSNNHFNANIITLLLMAAS